MEPNHRSSSLASVRMHTAVMEIPAPWTTEEPRPVSIRGRALIDEPRLNKSTAFPVSERDAFGLRGLLPARVSTIEEQVARELGNVRAKTHDLDRFIGLIALLDRNETVFYRLLVEHLAELMPIVYTPTVGLGCQRFSEIFRQPRGVWITPDDVDHIPEILRSAGGERIRLMVVTDNERILGLGDLGAGGMGIPIGKLALYIAGAGIHPSITLPVSLDVGTTNQELLDDPSYIGWRHERIRGPRYDAFLEAFVAAVELVCPRAVVQWEDFKQHNAIAVLDRYRDRIPSFNDDIQGTAGVALAGILASIRRLGGTLADRRVVFMGAGAAGIGMARLVRAAMRNASVEQGTIRDAILMLDSQGLLVDGRAGADGDKAEFSIAADRAARYGLEGGSPLEQVVDAFRPSILVGTTGVPGAFGERAIASMASHAERPVVLALSNPTSHTEATPEDIVAWSGGRALVATGSPFDPVPVDGRDLLVGQANNAFIFPGLGLGAIVAGVTSIPDDLFLAAAEELSASVGEDRLRSGALYPPQAWLREISKRIAIRVVRESGGGAAGLDERELERRVDAAMWFPDYVPYVPA
jgi:malate dehydrogenase (oxaloacetate-decarboxylating)